MSEQPIRRRRRQQTPSVEQVMPIEKTAEAMVPKAETIAPSIPRSCSFDGIRADSRTKTGLLEYIKAVIELETNVLTQERIIADYCSTAEARKPVFKRNHIPRKPNEPEDKKEFGGAEFCIIFAAFFFVIGFIIVSYCLDAPEWYVKENSPWAIFLFTVGGLLLLPYIGKEKMRKKQFEELNRQYAIEKEKYEEICKRIENENAEREAAYHENLSKWTQSNEEMSIAMSQPLEETKTLLASLYTMDIIYPKYRNLPALTSIYEYLVTGRCEELTGPHGAYNLYEDEVRKDTVISQLNTVIENLEQIRHNQYMLYEQVCAIQQNTAAIRSELAQIKGYTIQIAELSKLNAYYAARTEANTRITMYYHM